MAPRDEHQRAIELIHFIQEDGHVHGARRRHEVVGLPGAIVLVPLPEVAIESHLAVDLKLVHVDGFAKDLHDRLDHAWMAREPGERLAVHMSREVGTHRLTALLAHVFRPVLGIETRHLVNQDLDLLRGEQARKEEITLAVELCNLLLRKLHPVSSSAAGRASRPRACRRGPAARSPSAARRRCCSRCPAGRS